MIENGHDFRFLAYCDYYGIMDRYGSYLGLIGIFENEEDAIKAIEYTKDSIKMAVGSAGKENLYWDDVDYVLFEKVMNSTDYYADNAEFMIKKVELNRRYWFGIPKDMSWRCIKPELALGGYVCGMINEKNCSNIPVWF